MSSRWGSRVLSLLVFTVPLVFVLELRDTFDLPKMALVYGGVLLLTALGLISLSRGQEFVWKRSPLEGPVALFLLAALASSGASVSPTLSLWGAYRIYVFGLLPLTAFALLFLLTVQFSDEGSARKLEWAIMISGALVGFYALLQYAGLELFERMPKVEGGRPWSSLGNPLYTGSICMMSALLAWRKRGAAARVLFGLNLTGLLLSQSRSAWLGFLVAMGISFGLERHEKQKGKWIFALCFISLLLFAFPQVFQRSKILLSLQESSNAARVEGWKAAVKIWKAHPWLGSGPDTFLSSFRNFNSLKYSRSSGHGVSQADAHNDFLQVAATMGVIGVFTYIGVLIFAVKLIQREVLSDQAGMALALVALFVQNQFNFSSVSAFSWAAVMMGLLARKGRLVRVPMPRWVSPWMAAPFIVLLLAAGQVLVVRPVLADFRYQQGMAWTAGGRFEEARRSFQDAVRLHGRVEEYLMAYANRCRDLKYFDETRIIAERLVREHPHNPDSWNNAGVIAMWLTQLAGQNRMEEADRAFRKAVELDPYFLEAWANRARWEHLAGHRDEEIRLWEKVLTIDPAHAMARQVLQR